MNGKVHYSMLVQWSDEDDAFIVTVPEFDNARTHGSTYDEAHKMGLDLIETLIEFYTETNTPLPEPRKFDGLS